MKVREVIQEWKERELPSVKPRDVKINHLIELDHIIDILGVRRSGKTYLMFYIIKQLMKNFERENILYINFEDRALYPLTEKVLDDILDYVYEEGLLQRKKVFLFFDEIQNVPNWERWVRNIYDEYKGKIKIFLSGSSSKLARKEVSTLLTGRHISLKLFPLSFKEFLRFKGFCYKLEEILYSRKKRAKLKALLREYMKFGSFPEVVLANDELKKEEILRAYYEDILYKDIVEKFRIKEINVMENFLKFLLLNVSSYFSYKRAVNYLSSLGVKTSTRTLLKYTSIMEEVFLFFFVPILSKKVRDQLKYPRKIYCVDVGLRKVVGGRFSEDVGKIMENLVFLNLKRKNIETCYWKDRKGREVDFVVKEGFKVDQLIQVTHASSKNEVDERERENLLKASEELKCKNLLIITWDYEDEENIKGRKIKFIPLWKWLLS